MKPWEAAAHTAGHHEWPGWAGPGVCSQGRAEQSRAHVEVVLGHLPSGGLLQHVHRCTEPVWHIELWQVPGDLCSQSPLTPPASASALLPQQSTVDRAA